MKADFHRRKTTATLKFCSNKLSEAIKTNVINDIHCLKRFLLQSTKLEYCIYNKI
jgi:hypothetical protein